MSYILTEAHPEQHSALPMLISHVGCVWTLTLHCILAEASYPVLS